jgi:hypothetical protein
MGDFSESIEALATRSKVAERQALTEEATKTAVIMPFIQALGFDVFNLEEVVPEFVSDIGIKKGEKVDYAIKIDGKIAMLVEAKPIGSKLGDTQYNQLFRYFAATEARLAILTNGREAWFFTDTEAPNKMDTSPFFTFDFQKFDKNQLKEIARFQKNNFQIELIVEAASNLKYIKKAASFLKKQLEKPDDEFVRFIGRQIYEGSITKAVAEQLRPAIQSALDEIIRDRIEDKLSITLRGDPAPSVKIEMDQRDEEEVVTTSEEKEGFMIVRAIGAKIVPVDRITIRDSKSYCAVLMDDNNRRPICRLYFNSPKTKNIGIFDSAKNETKIRVDSTSDLYRHADAIESVIRFYSE